jgi:hypothetical protein
MRNDTNKSIVVWGTYDQTIGTRLPDERPVYESIVPSAHLEFSPFVFIMKQGDD